MNDPMVTEDGQMNDMQPGKKMNPLAIVGIVVIVAILGYVIMQVNGKRGDSEQMEKQNNPTEETMEGELPTPTPSGATESVSPSVETTQGVVSIAVEGGSFFFNPSTITVKKGDTVKITLTSKDMAHNLVIDEFNAKTPMVPAGKSGSVQFVADKAGTFEYYCSVSNHRQMGMVGTLIVTE